METTHIRTKAYEALNKIVSDEYISKNMERGIFNFAIWKSKKRSQPCSWENANFKGMYLNKVKQILVNISSESYTQNSKTTLNKILKKEIFPHEIAFMSCYEMSPEHWEKVLAEKKKRDEMQSEIDFGQATKQFRCGKCGGNKTTYYTMQTRSADESETIFITCLNCGARWRR